MNIGPKDKIDKKLVQMYANAQTNNLNISSIDPEKVMKLISLLSLSNKAFIKINNRKTA